MRNITIDVAMAMYELEQGNSYLLKGLHEFNMEVV